MARILPIVDHPNPARHNAPPMIIFSHDRLAKVLPLLGERVGVRGIGANEHPWLVHPKPPAAALLLAAALFAALNCARAANPAGVGPEAARASVKSFTVAQGLEASLFASEPMVLN